MAIWQELVTPEVRDLAWACFGPDLLAENQRPGWPADGHLPLSEARADRLRQLDRAPSPLLSFLGQRSGGRLGLYFEALWHFFLARDPDVELLAHNLPVKDATRTIGEFDLLYRDLPRERCVHLELAVKYYLGAPGSDQWIGPNQADRLDLKLDRLLQHQTRLGQHPAARPQLERLGIDGLERHWVLSGALFASRDGATTFPKGIQSVPGHWFSPSVFLEHAEASGAP